MLLVHLPAASVQPPARNDGHCHALLAATMIILTNSSHPRPMSSDNLVWCVDKTRSSKRLNFRHLQGSRPGSKPWPQFIRQHATNMQCELPIISSSHFPVLSGYYWISTPVEEELCRVAHIITWPLNLLYFITSSKRAVCVLAPPYRHCDLMMRLLLTIASALTKG
jgi:hypothetical protein